LKTLEVKSIGEANLRFPPIAASHYRIRYRVVLTRYDGLETRQVVGALAGKPIEAGGSSREEVMRENVF